MWEWLSSLLGGAGEAIGQGASAVGAAASAVPWNDVIGLGIQGLGAANSMGAFGPGGLFGNDPSNLMGSPYLGMGGQMPGMQAQAAGGANPAGIRRALADTQSQGLSGASPEFLASMAGVTPEELEKLLGYNQA